MSSALAAIDRRIESGCLVSSMVKGGCTVGTADAPEPFRIIDLDHAAAPVGPNAPKCDYLFLSETGDGRRLWAVPLELKATGLNPGTVTSQLQAGARIAERAIRGESLFKFVPVAAHGRKLHRRQYLELAKVLIKFRNREYVIMTMRCGSPLSSALK